MTPESSDTANPVNDLDSAHDSGSAASRTKAEVLPNRLQKKWRRRRIDLSTMHGALREGARVYRQLANGELSFAAAETLSRNLRRYIESLRDTRQDDVLTAINERVKAIDEAMKSDGTPMLPAPAALTGGTDPSSFWKEEGAS